MNLLLTLFQQRNLHVIFPSRSDLLTFFLLRDIWRKILLLKTFKDFLFQKLFKLLFNTLIIFDVILVEKMPKCVNYLVISSSLPNLKVYCAMLKIRSNIFNSAKDICKRSLKKVSRFFDKYY